MADDSHRFHAEVLTPEGQVFEGELYQLSARTVVGEVGIRARHAPMLARVVPHELRLFETESDFSGSGSGGSGERFAAAEGWLQVFANKVTILVGEASDPESLDRSDLEQRLSDAEQRLSEADEDSAAYENAERDRARAEAWLAIAGS